MTEAQTKAGLLKAAKQAKYRGKGWVLCGIALMQGIDDVAFLSRLASIADKGVA